MNIHHGQDFLAKDILQGYIHTGDTSYFLFSPSVYEMAQPGRVVLTGSFRGWSGDMEDEQWQLKQFSKDLWILSIYNPKYAYIPPKAPFKFRVNDGKWIDPPKGAPNEKAGNLVFEKDLIPETLYAEIRSNQAIVAKVEGMERPLNPNAYSLTDAKGNSIPIAEVLPQDAKWTLLVPKIPIDKRRVYFLSLPQKNLTVHCSFDGWFRELYSPKELGANITKEGTWFRIFSPRADLVKLYLYKHFEDKKAYSILEMEQDELGVWELLIKENLAGVFYDFTVHGPDDPGNFFYDKKAIHISDPYARVSMDTWGKCMVAPKTEPANPLPGGRPAMEDVIAYEVHVQDFTDRLPLTESKKGRLIGMIEPNLTNKKGQAIGFDHLINLGINVVHLMPVQEFLHYQDENWKPAFEKDPYMIEHGISEENYQWGYRTSHCFAIESRFRESGTEPGAEREQFRDLVQAFHDKGIAVVIDIVPNHTAENMDADEYYFHFNVLDKQYYYRTKDFDHIGAFGNEVKTENRPMVQKWLIDQCKHFVEEFGIDGFRIDLAGQIDQQTLYKLLAELPEDIIIYGEPWIGSNDPAYEDNPDWDWYKEDSPITFFNDDSRNAFKGTVFDLNDKFEDRGYAGGNANERDNVKKGLTNTFPEEKSPLSGINYLDIHDNWALADQFAIEDWDGRQGVEEGRIKIAATLLYTSLGPIVLHGGTEFMRSKGSGILEEVVKEMKDGTKVFLHGKRDTYNMRVPNQFVWENIGKTKRDKGSHCDYKGMLAFWQGLNRFRLSETGKVFRQAEPVPKHYYQFIEPENPYLLGYVVDKKVLVLLNTSDETAWFEDIQLPKGSWRLIGNNQGFDHVKGVKDSKANKTLKGGKTLSVEMHTTSLKVWVRN